MTARESKVIKLDMKRNVGRYPGGIEVPLKPFMGIMALYLPVFAPGALFYTGDSHAGQGDGEVDGNGSRHR